MEYSQVGNSHTTVYKADETIVLANAVIPHRPKGERNPALRFEFHNDYVPPGEQEPENINYGYKPIVERFYKATTRRARARLVVTTVSNLRVNPYN
jgi:hypothetical protein